jgi:manganese efflux pump family protein
MALKTTVFYFLLPLMLSMVHFSVSASNGIGEGAVKRGTPLKAALIFAISTFILTWIGYYLASLLMNRFDYKPESIAFVFFAIIGFRMILHAWQKKASKKIFDINEVPVIFALALALGMNMLFMGIAVAFLQLNAMQFTLILALTVLFLSFSGLIFGNQFGDKLGWKLELAAGIVVLANGLWLFSF